jgi:raffinose/stachyose/melibiose transport system permease protein
MKNRDGAFSVAFLAPAFLFYTAFMVLPILSTVVFSFTRWNGISPPAFSGFSNFRGILADASYWKTANNTFLLVFFNLVGRIPVALVLAFLLSRLKRGLKLLRTIYFFPIVVPTIAIGVMFALFYNSNLGPVNKFLEAVGLEFLQRNWLSDVRVVLYSVMVPQVWRGIGFFVVIFLAGISAIPRELFEVAEMDGTPQVRVLVSIVIPLLWDVIQVCIILAVIQALRSFELAWVITGGGPGLHSAFLSIYMFRQAFFVYRFGYASAVTVTMLLYALVFTVIFKRLTSRREPLQY